MNFAAETHVDRSIDDPESFLRTDIFGTHTLLEAVRERGIGRMVQVSTDEVYGSIDAGSFCETDRIHPSSPYSASKAGGDLQVLAYHTTYGTPALITRGSNTYGPYQYPEKLIPLFVTNALEGGKLPLYGDGLNVRDWLHVDDHADGIEAALLHGSPARSTTSAAATSAPTARSRTIILDELGLDLGRDRQARHRPSRPRPPLLDRVRQGARGAGLAAVGRLRDRPARHHPLVPRQRGVVEQDQAPHRGVRRLAQALVRRARLAAPRRPPQRAPT